MTAPDTKAIRAQMEPLDGFTPGPWLPHNQPGDWGLWGAHCIHVADASPYDWDQCIAQVEYQTPYCLGEKRSVIEAAKTAACNARLIAAAPDMHEAILALCDEVERLNAAIRAMTVSDHTEEASGDLTHSAVDTAVLRLLAMTDADRAAVARKFNARMEMTRRDGRLLWAKAGA